MEGYTARTAGLPTFSEEGPDHPYLWLENARSDDAPQMNTFQEAVTTRCAFSSRFATVTNLVLLSLLAFVPGTQASHLLHPRYSSFGNEDFPVSAAEGLFFCTGRNHYCRSLGTPDTFKDDQIVDNLSAISSLAMTFVTEKSDECRDAHPDATSRLNSIPGAATAPRLASFYARSAAGETPSALISTYSNAESRPTASSVKREMHFHDYFSPSEIPLSSTKAIAMQREDTVLTKVCYLCHVHY